MITGTIVLDVSHVEEFNFPQRDHEDRRVLYQLDRLPDGIKVIVEVGSRSLLGIGAMDYIVNNGQRLDIEIAGTEITSVAALVRMARSGPTEAA